MAITPNVFVSYRRDDNPIAAGRLADHLTRALGAQHVFRDPHIEPGTRFADALDQALASTKVLVVVVGPAWETLTNTSGQAKLFDPEDWVRREILRAMESEARIIPVLLERSKLPSPASLPDELQPFLGYQAHLITDRYWDQDVDALARSVAQFLGLPLLVEKGLAPTPPAERARQVGVALSIWSLIALTIAFLATIDDPDALLAGTLIAGALLAGALALTLVSDREERSFVRTLLLGPGLWAGRKSSRTLLFALALVSLIGALVGKARRVATVQVQCMTAERIRWKGVFGRVVERACPVEANATLSVWHPFGNVEAAVRSRLSCVGGSDLVVPAISDPRSDDWLCAIHSPRLYGTPIRTGYVRFRIADLADAKRWLSVGIYKLPPTLEKKAHSGSQGNIEAWNEYCTTMAKPLSIDVSRVPTNLVLRRWDEGRGACEAFTVDEPVRITGQVGDPKLHVGERQQILAGCAAARSVSFVRVGGDHVAHLSYGDRVKVQIIQAEPGCEWLGIKESRLACDSTGTTFVLEEAGQPKLLDYLQSADPVTLENTFHLGDEKTRDLVAGRPYTAVRDLVVRKVVAEETYERMAALMKEFKPPVDSCP